MQTGRIAAFAAALLFTTALGSPVFASGGSVCVSGCDSSGQHQPHHGRKSLSFEMNTDEGAYSIGSGKDRYAGTGGVINYQGHQNLGGGYVGMDFEGGAGSGHAHNVRKRFESHKDVGTVGTHGQSGRFVEGQGHIRAGDHARSIRFGANFDEAAAAHGYGGEVDGGSSTWGDVNYRGSFGQASNGDGWKNFHMDFQGGAASHMNAQGGNETWAKSGRAVRGEAFAQ
jgi:hypothetical protein